MREFVFITVALLSLQSYGQTLEVAYTQTPLKEVIEDIQTQTGVQFTYGDITLSRKQISIQPRAITLSELLTLLENQTGLRFEKTSETQVLIYVPDTTIAVCGYVFDRTTNTPLAFASIAVVGENRGDVSDEQGYFRLGKVERTAQLRIVFVGYQDLLLNATDYGSDNCKNIYLTPSQEALSEILIVSYLTQGINKNTDGTITSDTKNRRVVPGEVEPDVFTGLQSIPGIFSPDESASDFQVRGGSADQNLVLFDGIKLYNTGHFFGTISAINPYVTEETKIYKSGADVVYGDRISGVIDVRTIEKIPEKTKFGFGINGTHIDGFAKVRVSDKVAFVVSGRRSFTDRFQTPTFESLQEKVFQNTEFGENDNSTTDFDDIAQREEFFFYDTNAKLLIIPTEKDRISVSGIFTKNTLDYRIVQDEDVQSDMLQVKNAGLNIAWKGVNKGKWNHSLSGYISTLDSDYSNSILDVFDEVIQEENLRRNTIDEFGFDAQLSYALNTKMRIRAGYQFSRIKAFYRLFRDQTGDLDLDPDNDEIDPLEELDDGDGDVDLGDMEEAETRDFNLRRKRESFSNTFYTDYTWRPNAYSYINAGLRTAHYSLVNTLFLEPRLNVNYGFSKQFGLKLTAERRVQSISQLVEFEDTQIRLGNRIWTLSDQVEVPVLKSTQFSLGAFYSEKRWLVDIDAYIKDIKGLTSFTNGFTNVSEDINVGSSDVLGVDLLIKREIGSGRLWLAYTFNDIQYTFKDIQGTSFSGNNDITHNLHIAGALDFKNWEISLGYTFHTGAPFTPSEGGGDLNFGSINSERLPSYHRVDASAAWHFALSKAKIPEDRAKKIRKRKAYGTLGVSFLNILRREVALREVFRQDVDAITEERSVEQIEQLSLGFKPNAILRIYF